MNRLMYVLPVFFALLASGESFASNRGVVEELAGLLAGEFESRDQMAKDLANGVPEDQRHYWVNRSFQKVDAPKVGETILIGSTEYNFRKWVFDFNEFIVWTLTPGEAVDTVLMSPRRFKDQEKRVPFAREAWKLAGFAPEDLEAARGGASCEIVWKRSENGFIGKSEPCRVMSTTKGKILDWEWQLELTDRALWVEFNGRDETGASLDGTEKLGRYRLDRMN